jgi:hypothetical protein
VAQDGDDERLVRAPPCTHAPAGRGTNARSETARSRHRGSLAGSPCPMDNQMQAARRDKRGSGSMRARTRARAEGIGTDLGTPCGAARSRRRRSGRWRGP